MMRTADGHGRPELTKFHTQAAVGAEPDNAPGRALLTVIEPWHAICTQRPPRPGH